MSTPLNLSPSKEKFCSIITEIVDKSKDVIVETEDALEYDIIEITLLLKSIGFRLFSLEFNEPANENSNDIEIELKCKKSGLNSKMILQTNKCSCPLRKSTNNNSFWEVQGISPSTSDTKSKGLIQDSSCNLLPEVSKKSAKFSKAILSILLQNYQTRFLETKDDLKSKTLDVKQIVERFQLKSEMTKPIRGISLSPSTDNKLNVETKTAHCSTPLSSINVTPTPSYDGGSLESSLPKIITTIPPNETTTENNHNIDNTEDNSKKLETVNSFATEVNQSNENTTKSIQETEKTFSKLSSDNVKDICLIQEIQEARKHLDSALLMIKCNITRSISNSSSILTNTPQIMKKNKFKNNININGSNSSYLSATSTTPNNSQFGSRRYSTGSRFDLKKDVHSKPTSQIQQSKLNENKTNLIKRRTIDGSLLSMRTSGNALVKSTTELKQITNNTVKPIIKRASTGTNLKSSIKNQLTKSVGKLPVLTKDLKK